MIHETAYIGDRVTILGGVTIGANCSIGAEGGIYRCAEFGGEVIIEEGVTIGANVVIHIGREGETRIKKGAHIMSQCNIGHNVEIAENAVISAGSVIAGHAKIGSFAVVGINATIHQFCKVGESSIVGMGAAVVSNIPPFSKALGVPARVVGANVFGIERRFLNGYYE